MYSTSCCSKGIFSHVCQNCPLRKKTTKFEIHVKHTYTVSQRRIIYYIHIFLFFQIISGSYKLVYFHKLTWLFVLFELFTCSSMHLFKFYTTKAVLPATKEGSNFDSGDATHWLDCTPNVSFVTSTLSFSSQLFMTLS